MRKLVSDYRFTFVIPALIAFSAGWANGANLLSLDKITIDPAFTTPVIAGFPIENLFGGQTLTPENTHDTIFTDSGPGYRNVFFHLTDLNPIDIRGLVVDGAQDGPLSQSRSFSYFDLISYTFSDINNPATYHYSLLYGSGPVTAVGGVEHIAANVNLTNVGPYFVYQFGALDGSVQFAGPRVYDVIASSVPIPEPSAFLPFLLLGACGLVRRRQLNLR